MLLIVLVKLKTRIWNYTSGLIFMHYLNNGNYEDANKLLIKADKAIIMPTPAFLSLRGGDDNFETGILEFSHAYSCKFNDNTYDGGFNPRMFAVALSKDHAETLVTALETFIELNKEGSKKVKVSGDGKIINISNMFQPKE